MDELNTNYPETRKVIRISRRKLIWSIVLFVIIGALYFVLSRLILTSTLSYDNSVGPTGTLTGLQSAGYSGSQSPVYYDGYPYPVSDITDTREFMKTWYQGDIKTRDVPKVVTSVKNIVAGVDGRVDSFNSSEKSGRVSFVVAKSQFETLRSQIESLTYAKLYTETISSQNQLGTKQGIEQQVNSATSSLATLNAQSATLDQKHAQAVAILQAEMKRIDADIAIVKENLASATNTTDPALVASWNNQDASLANQKSVQNQKIATENANYTSQRKNLDAQIAAQNANLANANRQDTRFTNDIETVNGVVTVKFVSYWQLLVIYSPIHPIWEIIILIGLVWFYLDRKKVTPKIVIG